MLRLLPLALLTPLLALAEGSPPPPAEVSAEAPALRLTGEATAFTPRLSFDLWGGVRLEVPVSLVGTLEDTSPYALDRDGTQSNRGVVVSPRARIGVRLSGPTAWPVTLLGEYEHDLPTGSWTKTLPAGPGMPGGEALTTQLRKLSLRVSYREVVTVGGGVMLSNWGLGLVANDGTHGWEPGNARFSDQRSGDRVLRGFLATGPLTPVGLVLALAYDRVLDDDTLLLGKEQGLTASGTDDRAAQFVGSVSLGRPGASWGGLYVARRTQQTYDGRSLEVTAFDAAGTGRFSLGRKAVLKVGAELAYLTGTTTLTTTGSYPRQDVQQLGVLTRNSVDLGGFGFALDGAFASGDRNADDGAQNGFRADPNADMGLLLFRQVLAAQTARGVATASNPQLVGAAVPGLERLPTRGAFTNTLSVFPRAFWQLHEGVELYGGVLLAWSAVPLSDPFNSRLAGGALRNALDGRPGGLLGTEFDVGARARFLLWGSELMVGVEGGLLMPGGSFHTASGQTMGNVTGGRVMLGYRL